MKYVVRWPMACTLVVFFALSGFNAQAADKPNILVIWGDDIGWANISKYNHGMMGYKTPNIDKIADQKNQINALRLEIRKIDEQEYNDLKKEKIIIHPEGLGMFKIGSVNE